MIKGVGGIFWRTKDLEAVKKWYGEVLKIDIQHLEQIGGVPLAKKQESGEFGTFIWIEDPDGRLVELWEK